MEMKIGANFDPISNINISMTEATGVERIMAIIGLINDLNEINLYASNANKKLIINATVIKPITFKNV